MRAAPLTTIRGGINRLRTRGGARADNLYELLNGYVTEANTVVSRPGTARVAVLDALTRGLTAFEGSLHTYSHVVVTVPAGYTLHVLVHPSSTFDTTIVLTKIHFAAPFMGALYVVAEFADGKVYHYWLQPAPAWEANKRYAAGALVSQTTDTTRVVYRATRTTDPFPSWAPNVPRSIGASPPPARSIVEPTLYNDFYYQAVAATGNNLRSGVTEPIWPTEPSARVIETTDGGNVTGTPTTTPAPTADLPTDATIERYSRFRGVGP